MMKAIFLDVDGVLNSDEYFDSVSDSDDDSIENEIDMDKIKLLKEAVDLTDAQVVLSSSWRYTRKAQSLRELLIENGIVTDVTPFLQNKRGLEIKSWLKNNPDVDDFVILDDEVFDSYDDFLLSKVIKTSDSNGKGFGRGLLPKDVDKIVKQLGNNKNKNSCK
mgnify:FL=1